MLPRHRKGRLMVVPGMRMSTRLWALVEQRSSLPLLTTAFLISALLALSVVCEMLCGTGPILPGRPRVPLLSPTFLPRSVRLFGRLNMRAVGRATTALARHPRERAKLILSLLPGLYLFLRENLGHCILGLLVLPHRRLLL